LAANFASRPVRPLGSLRWVQWLVYHLLSFETFFLLFLYAIRIRQILPPIPGNEIVLFGVVTIAIGGWIILRDGLYLRGIPILFAGLAFFGWMLLSIGWTPSRVFVYENMRFIFIGLWALFAGACIIAGSRERVLRLLVMLAVLAVILAVYGVYIEFTYGSFRFYRFPDASGAVPDFAYIAWGYIAANGGAVVLLVAIHSRLGSLKQLLALAAFGLCSYFLLLAGGRGPLLGLAAATLIALLVQSPRIGHHRLEISVAQLLALGIIAIAIAMVGYLVASGQSVYTLNRLLTLFDQADDPLMRSGANRFDQFAGAYRLWLESPLFGHGLAGYYALYGTTGEHGGNNPHNIFLQTLAEFGIIGLVLLALFLGAGLRHFSLARLRMDPLALAVLMVFVTFLVNAMVAGDIATSYRFFFMIGLLALRPPAEEIEEDDERDDTEEEEEEEEEEEQSEGTTAAR
jgi:oligosaccharide repeat unit polymerase